MIGRRGEDQKAEGGKEPQHAPGPTILGMPQDHPEEYQARQEAENQSQSIGQSKSRVRKQSAHDHGPQEIAPRKVKTRKVDVRPQVSCGAVDQDGPECECRDDGPYGWAAYGTAGGDVYYHNAGTGVTQWGRPECWRGQVGAHTQRQRQARPREQRRRPSILSLPHEMGR